MTTSRTGNIRSRPHSLFTLGNASRCHLCLQRKTPKGGNCL